MDLRAHYIEKYGEPLLEEKNWAEWEFEDGSTLVLDFQPSKLRYKVIYFDSGDSFHRKDGPAYIVYNEDGELLDYLFYWNGVIMKLKEILEIVEDEEDREAKKGLLLWI